MLKLGTNDDLDEYLEMDVFERNLRIAEMLLKKGAKIGSQDCVERLL